MHQTLRSQGQLLDTDTRAYFEPRYGHDFSRVRVHADRQASEAARAVDAAAYTVGSQIVFAEGRYQPRTAAGRRLLAHELAHVAQQRNASVPGTDLKIGNPSDAAERAADAAAQHALVHPATCTVDAIGASATVRRETRESWAGTFDNDLQYDLINKRIGKKHGAYGTPIQIRFTPKPVVSADKDAKVAFVQIANSSWNDEIFPVGTEAEAAATAARSTPAGSHIDQLNTSSTTPLVGMKNPSSGGDLAASVPGKNARFGIPSAKNLQDRQAWLFDPAGLDVDPDGIPDEIGVSQSLETAALAVSGPQKGVYYGSVRWGWDKPPDAKVATQKKFELVSKDAPSLELSGASTKWNESKTDQGGARIPLPITQGKYVAHAGAPLMERADGGKQVTRLEFNERVETTDQPDPKHPDWSRVIVTEGSHTGKQGWVKTALLDDYKLKKSR